MQEKEFGPKRVIWFTRNLPAEVYDYAAYWAKRHLSLVSVNTQILDMIRLGYLQRLKEDKARGIIISPETVSRQVQKDESENPQALDGRTRGAKRAQEKALLRKATDDMRAKEQRALLRKAAAKANGDPDGGDEKAAG